MEKEAEMILSKIFFAIKYWRTEKRNWDMKMNEPIKIRKFGSIEEYRQWKRQNNAIN